MQVLKSNTILSRRWGGFCRSTNSAVKSRRATGTPHHLPSRAKGKSMFDHRVLTTIGLLVTSNVFMTIAWYGHLKHTEATLWKVILISWGIAFFEYCFQVPANRIGYGEFSPAQLKTIQEIITLIVFAVFATVYLKEALRWNHFVGFAFLVGAAFFIFKKW
jgi:uncharacterized protein